LKKKEETPVKPKTTKKEAVKPKKESPKKETPAKETKKKTTTKAKPKKKKAEKVVKVKEPKAQKGFKFVVKDDVKYEVPKTRVEAEYIDGKAHCPTCHQRNFELTNVDCGDGPFEFKGEGTCRICTTRINYIFKLKLNDTQKEEPKDDRPDEGKQTDKPVQKRRKTKGKTDGGGEGAA
jgi:hypothetical protein